MLAILNPYNLTSLPMNTNDPTIGRILIHGQGSGGVSARDIEKRARELADIDGRSGADITTGDLARAEAELTGTALRSTTAENEVNALLSRDPSEPVSVAGHEIPSREGLDEEKIAERLALEGVEEAQHEQMLAARRRERRLEEGDVA